MTPRSHLLVSVFFYSVLFSQSKPAKDNPGNARSPADELRHKVFSLRPLQSIGSQARDQFRDL